MYLLGVKVVTQKKLKNASSLIEYILSQPLSDKKTITDFTVQFDNVLHELIDINS